MKGIQRSLLQAIGSRIAPLGFSNRSMNQSFVRAIPDGRASLHVAFIEHSGDFDVVADVAVRFDRVEEAVNAGNALLSKRDKESTYTLGAELGNIAGEGQKRWTVASLADVEPVAEQVVSTFAAVGLPYIQNASSLEGALQLLSSPGREGWLHSPIHASRAKRVVAIAMELGRLSEVEQFAREGEKMLQDLKDPGLLDFKRFLSRLDLAA